MKAYSFFKRKAIAVVVLFLLFTMSNTAFPAAEIQDAPSKLQTDVQTLFHQEKFGELESMANKFRTEKARFPGGGWKIFRFYHAFSQGPHGWDELIGNMDKWMKMYPDSITARVAAAGAWVAYAWKARGSGYADSITETGLALWKERLAKAYELVKDPPKDPSKDCMHRYRVLLIIARAQGWDRQRYEALFQKAVSFEPAYYALYDEKLTNILPRWDGEEGEWQKFADEAVKLTPKSEGMGIYARILWYAWNYNEFTKFREPDISWKKMKQGFRDIERNYPDSPLILNTFCFFACIAEDKETARELFRRIGDNPDVEVWKGRSNFYKYKKWAGLGD